MKYDHVKVMVEIARELAVQTGVDIISLPKITYYGMTYFVDVNSELIYTEPIHRADKTPMYAAYVGKNDENASKNGRDIILKRARKEFERREELKPGIIAAIPEECIVGQEVCVGNCRDGGTYPYRVACLSGDGHLYMNYWVKLETYVNVMLSGEPIKFMTPIGLED